MRYEKTTLPSGLRVVTTRMPATRSVAVNVYVGAGARNEQDHEIGVAHFLEHLFFKGTHRRPTAREISEAIEGVGGVVNAATDRELTVYYAKVGRPHFALALDVLADMLRNSRFDPVEIEKERTVVIEEISMYQDQPGDLVAIKLDELMWPGQALGRDIAGTPESVAGLSRETIVNYVDTHYGPGSTVVSVAGDLEHEVVVEAVARAFEGWHPARPQAWPPAIDGQTAPRALVVEKDTEQAHFCLAVPGVSSTDPRRWALDMLNVILGEGMSCRLFLEVREHLGLAYDVHSYTSHFSDTGAFTVYAGVDPDRIDAALEAVLQELRRVRHDIPESELVKAKEFSKGRMFLRMEDSRSVASSYGAQELVFREIKTVDEMASLIDAVRLEDVLAVAQDLLRPERLNLAVVGPVADARHFLDRLHL